MFSSLALGLALLALAAPVPKDVPPAGPAPLVAELKPNLDGKVLVTVVRMEARKITNPTGQEHQITSRRTLQIEIGDVKELQVTTAAGKAVELKDALAKLKDGAVVVITTDGKKVDSKYLRVFQDDTLVLVSPERIGTPRPTGTVRPLPIQPLPAKPIPPAVENEDMH